MRAVVNTDYRIVAFVSNLASGTVTTCTAAEPAFFNRQPNVGVTGELTLTVGTVAGTAAVTCNAATRGTTTGRPFTFTVISRELSVYSRIQLDSSVVAFSRARFVRAMLTVLRRNPTNTVVDIAVYYVCPKAVCLVNGQLQCPTSHAARLGVGCRNTFASGRGFEVLQNTNGVAVDFDFIVDDSGNTATDTVRDASVQQVNTAITACNADPSTCVFTQEGIPVTTGSVVTNIAAATPIPTVITTSDDSGMPWWGIALIITGSLLVCAIGSFFMLRHRPSSTAHDHEEPRELDSQDGSMKSRSVSQSFGAPVSISSPAPVSRELSREISREPSQSPMTGSPGSATTFVTGDNVNVLYVDGQSYDAQIQDIAPDGTCDIVWEDGSYSLGVPSDRMTRVVNNPIATFNTSLRGVE